METRVHTADVGCAHRKGPSFLSRLGMRGKKKDARDMDSDSELGSEARMDGINAMVFSQSLAAPYAGVGYIPHHKEPPRYIRTKSNNKKVREFDRMFLAQELVGTLPQAGEENGPPPEATGKTPIVTVSVAGANGRRVAKTGGAIWATEFSKDGKYFATAGKDHVVRIWAVISTPEDRKASEEEEAANGGSGERLSAPVFRCRPVQEFQGHTGEVLDLSWSKNSFLLSSSMDKTVRLWHISRAESICTFKHKDFVTRLAFHPTDDRFFLAGSLDTMLRLWSIPDKTIAFSVQLPDLVTAVAFTPDGRTAIAGLLNGLCLFFDTEGLSLQTQIHVRSSRGKNAKGSKITSIQTLSVLAASSASQAAPSVSASQISGHLPDQGEVRVLITSNDSRIRIYSLRDKTLEIKLKGHDNSCAQIAATFSDDGSHVICGSEDRKTFIWSLSDGVAVAQDKDKTPCEYFDAHGDMVTTAVFAPTSTRVLLGHSGDPIYDLCNPPPVVLRCIGDEASASASQSGAATPTPAPKPPSKRPEPSAGYISRSTHYDGNIIVTTDDTGIIKVFRQDCAYTKRRNENWETGSTISRKLTAHGGVFVGSGVGRSSSILTRTSASSAAHSRRGSLSQSVGSGVIASPRLGTHPTSSDRILSWRQSIEHGHDRRNNGSSLGASTPTRSSVRSERSPSPTKNRTPLGSSAANLASDARRQPYAHSTLTSPTNSVFSHATPDQRPGVRLVKRFDTADEDDDMPRKPPLPSFTYRSAGPAEQEEQQQIRPDQGATNNSTPFWALSRWKGIAGFKAGGTSSQGQAGHSRAPSNGSLLPWSKGRIGGGDGAADDGEEPAAAIADKGKGKEKHSRRQSLGVVGPAPTTQEGGRRRSLPPGHARAGSADAVTTPKISLHAAEEEEGSERGRAVNPVQARHERSPYRHLWGRGSGAGTSRRSSDRGGDEDIEEVEETSDDEFTDAEQGTPR